MTENKSMEPLKNLWMIKSIVFTDKRTYLYCYSQLCGIAYYGKEFQRNNIRNFKMDSYYY